MGFNSFNEAYNVLGLAAGAKPTSIKNYRDEFDPMFPNPRKGWHKRPLRAHCQRVYNEYEHRDINEFATSIAHITGCAIDAANRIHEKETDSYAKRLLTGRAAENYFKQHYEYVDEFRGAQAEDVTQTGCGYDFSLHWQNLNRSFAVEVKGLMMLSGNIMFTEKEHAVAEKLTSGYFVYVVKNFCDKPFAQIIRDPLSEAAGLIFRRQERKIVQISWNVKI